jgi:hypothetical protein
MPISEKEYFDLREYWDYQRKVEYNRELAYNKVSHVWQPHEVDQIFPTIWSNVNSKLYLDPPSNYVPEDKNYRLQGDDIDKWRAVPNRFGSMDDID